jgi:hypothetical protein
VSVLQAGTKEEKTHNYESLLAREDGLRSAAGNSFRKFATGNSASHFTIRLRNTRATAVSLIKREADSEPEQIQISG